MGASKASRIINHYAARPQLQETLCEQVVTRLEKLLQPKALLILMRAEHGCMKCRGIKQYGGAAMMTSAVRGHFKDDGKARAEAMDMIKISMR
jgi:GTP cyclohydrolase I